MDRDDELAIIALCSQLVEEQEFKPLETKEWSNISKRLIENKKSPKDLFEFSSKDFVEVLKFSLNEEKRIRFLLDRSSRLAFEIEKLNQFGIKIVTRASHLYPKKLKCVLGQNCPPIFYYSGNIDLLNKKFIGFVGSRDFQDKDGKKLETLVINAVNGGYGVVSGGAKGVDSISSKVALQNGGEVIEFLCDGMMKKLKNAQTSSFLREGKLLLLSYVNPNAGFNVGTAMQRNKFIYAQSVGTVVVKTKFNEGGTWTGAIENLKQNYAQEFCLKDEKCSGNLELIKRGAIPIDENFDFSNIENKKQLKQASFFD